MPFMDQCKIQRAKKEDYVALGKIAMSCYEVNIDPEKRHLLVKWMMHRYHQPQRFEARSQKGVVIRAIYLDATPIGYYELERNGFIANFYISVNHQHQGLGKQMMKDLETQASHHHMSVLSLDSNMNAIGFYERMGYEMSGPSVKKMGITLQPMKKKMLKT